MEDCCKPTNSAAKLQRCPTCGKSGKAVNPFTLSVMTKDQSTYLHPESLPDDGFFFCETPSCDMVYFNREFGTNFTKSQLRIKVWQKEEGDPDVPACYCFGNSISTIQREILEKGRSDVLYRIGREVKEGNCRCEVTNPQGSCCLGNVAKALKLAKQSLNENLTNPLLHSK